jgi:hypothetical protein
MTFNIWMDVLGIPVPHKVLGPALSSCLCSEPIFLEQPPFSVLTLHQKISSPKNHAIIFYRMDNWCFTIELLILNPIVNTNLGTNLDLSFHISCPVKYNLHSKGELLTK